MKVIAVVLVVTLVASSPALGATPTDEIRGLVKHTSGIFADPATRDRPIDRLNGVIDIIGRVFAFDEAAQMALGREWTARPAPEREEFLALFTQHVERSLVLTGASKADLLPGAEVRYLGESIARDSATVQISLITRDGQVVPVEFRMVARRGGWAIRDVVVEGASLVGALQASFNRVLRNAPFADLLARMRARTLDVPNLWSAAHASGSGAPVAPVESPSPAAAPASVGRAAASPPPTTVESPGATAAPPSPTVMTPSPSGTPPSSTVRPPAPTVTPPSSTVTPPARAVTPSPRGTAAPAPVAPPVPTVTAPPAVGTAPTPRESAKRAEDPSPPDAARAPESPAVIASVPPVRPTPPAPPTPTFWLQLGLFSHPDAAQPLVEELLKRNLQVEISPVDLKTTQPDVQWTRVRVGPFADRALAAATQRQLERRGYAPFLVTEPAARSPRP